jgi:hypothetical protein
MSFFSPWLMDWLDRVISWKSFTFRILKTFLCILLSPKVAIKKYEAILIHVCIYELTFGLLLKLSLNLWKFMESWLTPLFWSLMMQSLGVGGFSIVLWAPWAPSVCRLMSSVLGKVVKLLSWCTFFFFCYTVCILFLILLSQWWAFSSGSLIISHVLSFSLFLKKTLPSENFPHL